MDFRLSGAGPPPTLAGMADAPEHDAPPTGADDGRRRFSESCERNRGPIADVLGRVLPEAGLVLEIGSGTGQHAAYFAPRFPALDWRPSDPDPELRASIAAWRDAAGAPNLLPPVDLDVTRDAWPVSEAVAVFSANMIHIAPWACCLGLMAGAGRVLSRAGMLFLYGPFLLAGRPTAPSNVRFDESLKARDPAWGIRDLADVAGAAADQGLELAETVDMPANNLMVVFRRRGSDRSGSLRSRT